MVDSHATHLAADYGFPLTESEPDPHLTEYSPEEAASALRKVDFIVLPCIVLAFMMLQFDRTNLGNAQTDNFVADLGMTTANINTGQTLFTLGIVLLELPSNIIAKRVGPQRWIPIIMVIWGTVTFCQAFLKGVAGFYATRFLLAAGEAGFIPGMAWYLTRFYKNDELSLRLAIFWSSNSFAGMCSGPLALGILRGLSNRRWHAWQYLFLIEGLMTIFVAGIVALVLPASPVDGGRSLIGRILSERDAAVLASRTIRDDPKKAKGGMQHRVTWDDIKSTLTAWQLYGHCAAALLSSVILTPINIYGPRLVQQLGYSGYTANGMAAPASAIGLVFSIALAYSSDKTRERGLHIALAMALSFAGCIWLAAAPSDVGKRVLYGGYLLAAGTMGTGQAINASWLSSRFDDRKRPVALAIYVMSIQIAGFAGSNVFKASDAPRYTRGLTICGICAVVAALIMVAWKVLYLITDRRSTIQYQEKTPPQTPVHSGSQEKFAV